MYGVPSEPSAWWPQKEPASSLDYTFNAAPDLTDPNTGLIDPLSSATLAVSPSGDGEVAASRLSVDATGTLVTVWLSGGVAGRSYIVSIIGATAAGRTYQWALGILCDPLFAAQPLPPPPAPGFGAPITATIATAPAG